MSEHIIQNIPIDQIYRNPGQPRKTFRNESLQELAASIQEHDVIQPITVEPLPSKSGKFMLVAGERRLRASKLAGKTTIRAIVQDHSNHNGRERLITGLVENIQREDMNPIDEAEAYCELRDFHHMKPEEIAKSIGKSTTLIYTALQRLALQPKVQELMRNGKLSADRRVVAALLSIQDPDAQVGLAERALQRKMTIPGIVMFAGHVKAALEAKKLKKTRNAKSPAMNVAPSKYKVDIDDETPPPNWNALVQLGKVLPWAVIVDAANSTCARCELRSMASEAVCGQCPAVDMLGYLARSGDRS
jgi:ParB/RepB/Spo0J family partition protein